MKKSAFEVIFIDGSSVEEWAFNSEQAKILAQADRINKGMNYDVKECNYIGKLPS